MSSGRSTVELHDAASHDAAAITRVFLAAREASMPYLPALHSADETAAWIAEVVLEEDDVCVAVDASAVVGFAALRGGVLEHLYVLPERQGEGIGTALLDWTKGRSAGFALWVFQRNERARRFYEARGLRLVRLTDGSANEDREPDALYAWGRLPASAAECTRSGDND